MRRSECESVGEARREGCCQRHPGNRIEAFRTGQQDTDSSRLAQGHSCMTVPVGMGQRGFPSYPNVIWVVRCDDSRMEIIEEGDPGQPAGTTASSDRILPFHGVTNQMNSTGPREISSDCTRILEER